MGYIFDIFDSFEETRSERPFLSFICRMFYCYRPIPSHLRKEGTRNLPMVNENHYSKSLGFIGT